MVEEQKQALLQHVMMCVFVCRSLWDISDGLWDGRCVGVTVWSLLMAGIWS